MSQRPLVILYVTKDYEQNHETNIRTVPSAKRQSSSVTRWYIYTHARPFYQCPLGHSITYYCTLEASGRLDILCDQHMTLPMLGKCFTSLSLALLLTVYSARSSLTFPVWPHSCSAIQATWICGPPASASHESRMTDLCDFYTLSLP